MISRLKTPEEEREVEIEQARVVRTSKDDVQRFLKDISYAKIPKHLKRIRLRGNELLVLLDVGSEDNGPFEAVRKAAADGFGRAILREGEDPGSLVEVVDVPRHQPETEIQYLRSSALWPCFKPHRRREEPDTEYVMRNIGVVEKMQGATLCCGMCLIASEEGILSIQRDSDDVLGHAVLKAVEDVSKSQIGYLCTGFDAFVLEEPCLSCSIALVHGRIRRVFCARRGAGAFSRLKINYNKSLNHRYPVYFADRG